MAKKLQRIHRPRNQTPEQEAAGLAVRRRFQQEKPSLQDLVDRGDIGQVSTMEEYWELCKTFAGLKLSPAARIDHFRFGGADRHRPRYD